MRKICLVVFALGLTTSLVPHAAADIYVTRMGTGAAALTNTPVAVATFVDKYSDAGSLLTTYTLPATLAGAGGSNRPLTEPANSTSIGHMALSTNGLYLTLGGIDADAGTANARQSTTGRVMGRITLSNGSVDTTTSLTDAYPGSANNNNDVRSVLTTDGNSFYSTGTSFPTTGNNNSGTHYATLGATTSFRLSTNLNTRVGNIYNNKLYVSSSSGGFVGLNTIVDPSNPSGLPVPTADNQSNTTNILATGAGSSPYDFWFKDDNTVYIADDRATNATPTLGGGIQKWTFDGSAWSLAYTLTTNLGTGGVRGLDGAIVGGNAQLWATTAPSTTDGTPVNAVVSVIDTGATSAFSPVFSAATNTTVRGVVHITPAGLLGDFNSDGKVDAGDYATWRKAFDGSPTAPGAALANDNGLGTPITVAHYNLWRSHFASPPGAGSELGLGSESVPEPASAMLLVIGLVSLCSRRRRA